MQDIKSSSKTNTHATPHLPSVRQMEQHRVFTGSLCCRPHPTRNHYLEFGGFLFPCFSL